VGWPRLTDAEVDQVAQFAGDLASTLTVAAIATVAVGGATFAFVRAVRAWKQDDQLFPRATKTAILATFLVGCALEWLSTRPRGYEASHVNPIVGGAFAIAVLLMPVLLLAWALGAARRGRRPKRMPAGRSMRGRAVQQPVGPLRGGSRRFPS
jgi:hypothetical protein